MSEREDDGIHSSYWDCILKDSFDRIHIFEVKSVNCSIEFGIDKNEYEKKIRELKECYKIASKLTGYYFYLPIKKDNDWYIIWYYNGEEQAVM